MFTGYFAVGGEINGRLAESDNTATCGGGPYTYTVENADTVYDWQDFGPVTPVFDAETDVTFTFVRTDDSCFEGAVYLAYSGEYDPDNRSVGFLGHADLYYTPEGFTVTAPAGSSVNLILESFYGIETEDALLPGCTVDFIIETDLC